MEIEIFSTGNTPVEIEENILKLYADIASPIPLSKGEEVIISTGIEIKLPEDIRAHISGDNIKEFFVESNIGLITLFYVSKTSKIIKPQELLGKIEFIPKKMELIFKIKNRGELES